MSTAGDVGDPDAGEQERASLERLVTTAVATYRKSGRFARFFARGKLASDPLFATLLRTGAIPDASCLVDLGCGQALLAVWLHAARAAAQSSPSTWPASWPTPPKVGTYLGIDHARADIARARRAMPAFARVFKGDIRTVGMTMLDRCDVVTLFDVLQYLDFGAQEKLVAAMATSLPPWGTLVLRVGEGAARSLRWTDVVDLAVCACRGHPRRRLHRRPLDDWRALFESHGFVVETLDDGRAGSKGRRAGSPNVLLRATRAAAGSGTLR